jgi:hypothetical protein
MRCLLTAITLAVLSLESLAQGSPKRDISELPAGTVSGNTYTNTAFRLNFEFPADWTASRTADLTLEPDKPNSLANRCSKILLWLHAPSKGDHRFSSFTTLFAIDPACISAPVFPQSMDRNKIDRVVDKVVKVYKGTPFLSPYGVKVIAVPAQGGMNIRLTGGIIINAIAGHPAAAKEPIDVSTSFTVTQSNGYWLVWAYLADERSVEQLKNASLLIDVLPSSP